MPKNIKKKNRLTKPFLHFSSLSALCITAVILGVIFSLFMHIGYASWKGPDQDPPQGNVNPPLNVSSIAQTKEGGLCIGIPSTIICNASQSVGIGTETPLSRLTVRGKGNTNLTSSFYVNNLAGDPGLFIDDSRQVGIRTITPNYPLTVNGDIAAIENGKYILSGSSGISEIYMDNKYAVFETDSSNGSGFIFKPKEVEQVRIDSDGQVGIGMDNPQARLDVKETLANSAVKAVSNDGNSATIYAQNNNPSGMAIQGSGKNYGVSGSSNNIGVYGLGSIYGVYGQDESGANYGILGDYNDGAGVYGEGENYGVYGELTSPAANHYAGYFKNGDVRIENAINDNNPTLLLYQKYKNPDEWGSVSFRAAQEVGDSSCLVATIFDGHDTYSYNLVCSGSEPPKCLEVGGQCVPKLTTCNEGAGWYGTSNDCDVVGEHCCMCCSYPPQE